MELASYKDTVWAHFVVAVVEFAAVADGAAVVVGVVGGLMPLRFLQHRQIESEERNHRHHSSLLKYPVHAGTEGALRLPMLYHSLGECFWRLQ